MLFKLKDCTSMIKVLIPKPLAKVSLCSFGATRFCQTNSQFDSGLNKVEHENNITAGTKSVAHPIQMYPAPINKDERQKIQNIVSIFLAPQYISFSHIQKGYQVIDWQVESLHKISSSHKFLLLTEVKNILSTIPPADVYVFEERRVKLKFLGAFSVVMKISNIEAMMIALLSQRSNPNFTSKHSPIALLKAKDVSAHFDLKVGGKLVSGQSAIDSLIEKNGYRKNGPRVELKKPEYNLLSSDKKEMLCKSLLLGLYFGDNICWISDDSENKQ